MVILQTVPAISITGGLNLFAFARVSWFHLLHQCHLHSPGTPSLALPLSFILVVTAIKDLVEDIRRHQSDNVQNMRTVEVVDQATGSASLKYWQDIQVGMVLRLFDDEAIPADVILLHSSNKNGMAYVTTAGLDGETNLKLRKTVML